ncbi:MULTISPECIES: TIGR02270 family protein [unclassified Rhizobacter]|uniref:TIGR02270 family protein n=1 Tax=unclassified Rhizobacter TaxID=2640088 RepID=UPI0006FD0912|nr:MULTISPECIES: TIGR02270 family protein [unclassified Rhizobacter]KQU73502.1 hypothetical protein ASC88_04630 [Rhizobacter sp. Root29]KQV98687.1 hypothetical protein ASC98_08460 [Rhizobacter sp. Root1238]KRB04940.1 hypothetical protein ASE08_13615 [Rhizobacter sp. Root16D2]
MPALPDSSAASPFRRPPVKAVLQQHLEDAAVLRSVRSGLVRAPHVRLHHLRRLDDRLAAHLDGVAEAGAEGIQWSLRALEQPTTGAMFTAGVNAIRHQDPLSLDTLVAIAEAEPAAMVGLVSAFGWVPANELRGTVQNLLTSASSARCDIGLAACRLHQVDPGAPLDAALSSGRYTGRVLAAAGESGRTERLPACLTALTATNPALRLLAARSALLLGDRTTAMDALSSLLRSPGGQQAQATGLWLRVAAPDRAADMLRSLAKEPAQSRLLIRAIAAAGDPFYIPWLITQMTDARLTRLAGESFSMITGLDLSMLDMELDAPANADQESGESADESDPALDEDHGLPWPDPSKIQAWWQTHGSRFTAGTKYFVGAAPTWKHCLSVLTTGLQRQRMAAAEYLCLLKPGTPLFNVAAPAWRQQRLVASIPA